MLPESKQKELKALISMLDDPDEKVFMTLRSRVLSFKDDAFPLLEKAWMEADDLMVAERLDALMDEVNFRYVYESFANWLKDPDGNVLDAVLLINKLGVRDVDLESVRKHVESIIKDAWLELNDSLTSLEKINVLNHIFYVVHKFDFPKTPDDSIPAFFLSNLLDNKRGNPTIMGLLYMIVARVLNLPVYGVNLPGHLITAYVNDKYLIKNDEGYDSSDVIFYINPYNKGAVFTRNEIDLYIKQLKIEPKENYYTPSSDKEILRRYLVELGKSYKLHKKNKEYGFVQKLLGVF